jgi:hypothetical protein
MASQQLLSRRHSRNAPVKRIGLQEVWGVLGFDSSIKPHQDCHVYVVGENEHLPLPLW